MPDEMTRLIGNAEEFPVLRSWDFFNHAGVSVLPRCGGEALRRFALQYESAGYLNSGYYREVEALRVSAARMIGAQAGEIAFVKNTSEGIATVAYGIDWREGDRIVTTDVEYPANMYPWMDVSRRFGAEVVLAHEVERGDGSRGVDVSEILKLAEHPRTRMVALSHVEYASGQRLDVGKVGAFCRERGILFCVDAIQTMGVLPIDVRAMNIDYLSADGHKWLMGPEGAGVFYCRKELLEKTRPLAIGWMNVINDQDYGNYDLTLKSDARKFECGTNNLPGLLALKASLEMLLGLGVKNVAGRLKVLTDLVVAGLRERGFVIVSPRGEGEWSGGVSFVAPGRDQVAIWKRLRTEHQTEIALREGRLRYSGHFYNTEEQVGRFLRVVGGRQ